MATTTMTIATAASAKLLLNLSLLIIFMATSALSMAPTAMNMNAAGKASPVTLRCYLYIRGNKNFIPLKTVTSSTGETMILHAVGLPVKSSANESTAKVVGHARGLTFQTSGGDSGSAREQVFETIEYNDGMYNGTLAIHGQISFPPVEGDEIAIVGGTGDFRRVTGFAFPSLETNVTSDPIILGWEIHLFFPHY